jgi:Zn-dependent protease with chaperone function
MRIALSLPLGLLALLALVIGIAFAIFLGAKWSSESPRALIGGLIAGAMFLGFGIKLLQVLWSRKHDKTIP